MERIPEPELMEDEEQAEAYARADFAEAHQSYVDLFARFFPGRSKSAVVLDLGCGACDVVIRFARANPGYQFDAVDGSAAMLRQARQALESAPDMAPRVTLIEGFIPGAQLPRTQYDVILSNSFLHHLHRPGALWETVRFHARPGTLIFITDLRRPETPDAARSLVERYAAREAPILRRDFHNSLLAAFTPEEVREQLADTGLASLQVETLGDRHLAVIGVAS
jgi:SAM-dependent methyltransferase